MRCVRSWALVVPVKPLDRAKSRLEPPPGADRPGLALAFALDTVQAARRCAAVDRVLVVSPDQRVAEAFAGMDVAVLTAAPDGINPALQAGSRSMLEAGHTGPLAALTADLPALLPAELEAALDAAATQPLSFLPDADAVGTTLYCAREPRGFAPAYGARSRAAHLAGGAAELVLGGVDTVRRDVDTAADLASARALGLGPCTSALLTRAA
ncbi:2-phospho-L-lactate guanylyltransferase [Motilibacter sp. K478]|nr:2-phospho-L-lactate guanylyltransferase [Motilibacter aurantiacus]